MLLKNKLTEIARLIELPNKKNSTVSDKGVDWHLNHTLIIISNVSKILKRSDSLDYTSNFNFMRSVIFTLSYIPRGKGKAPEAVNPPDTISKEDLLKKFEEAKQQLDSTTGLPSKGNFKHPLLGVLNLKQSMYFLKIHTEHHLKICRDINKQD